MKKIILTASLLILFGLMGLVPAISAQAPTSSELIKYAKQYDSRIITYSGEIIGEVLRQGEFVWLNINDGENALGVWVDAGLVKEVFLAGSYKTRGDRIEITGVFNRACAQHGGELDIHAQSLRKIGSGRIVKEKLNVDKINLSFILLGALLLVWILTLFKHK